MAGNPRLIFRRLFWLALFGVGVLSVVPAVPGPAGFEAWDKAQHAIAFAFLAWLGLASGSWLPRNLLIGLLGYGVMIEVVQFFLPWRTADFFDIVANAVGLMLVYIAVRAGFFRKGTP